MFWKRASNTATASAEASRGAALHWSLAARLTWFFTAGNLVLLVLVTLYQYWTMVAHLDSEHDHLFSQRIAAVQNSLSASIHSRDTLTATIGETSYSPEPIYVRVLDRTGEVLAATPGMPAWLTSDVFEQIPAPGDLRGRPRTVYTGDQRPFRVLSVRLSCGEDAADACQVQLALDHSSEHKLLSAFWRRVVVALGVGIGLCALIGYQIAHYGVKPLESLTETMRRIGSATLDQRLNVTGYPREVAAMGESFNAMLDRLEEAFGRLSRFSADLAHELRTPLNNLRGEVEVALDHAHDQEQSRAALSSCLEECQRLSRIIDSLLFLARAEIPEMQIQREPLDVARELAGLRDFYEASAAEAGVELAFTATASLPADLDRTLMQRAVGNLIENALAHTPRGGRVTLGAALKDGAVELMVADSGCGIAPERLPRVFDRFYRADPSRTRRTGGVGLGLSIVKSIAQLHGGSVEIQSQPGVGTTVRMRLPCMPGDVPR